MVNKNHVGSSIAAGQQRSQACISRRINSMFVFHFFNVGSEFGHILISGQKRYMKLSLFSDFAVQLKWLLIFYFITFKEEFSIKRIVRMQAERSNNDSFRDVHVCQCFQLNFML